MLYLTYQFLLIVLNKLPSPSCTAVVKVTGISWTVWMCSLAHLLLYIVSYWNSWFFLVIYILSVESTC